MDQILSGKDCESPRPATVSTVSLRFGWHQLHDQIKRRSPRGRAPFGGSAHRIEPLDLVTPAQFVGESFFVVALSILVGWLYSVITNVSPPSVWECIFVGCTMAVLLAGADRLNTIGRTLAPISVSTRMLSSLKAWTLACLLFGFVAYALKAEPGIARAQIIALFLIGAPGVAVWRIVAPPVIARLWKNAVRARRECLVVGSVDDKYMDAFVDSLVAAGYPAPCVLRFNGSCGERLWSDELRDITVRALDESKILNHGDVFLCAGVVSSERLLSLGTALSALPRAIYLVPDAHTASLARCRPTAIGSHLAMEIRREPLGAGQRVLKRLLDITIASTALVFLAPLLLLVALAIKLDSPGPAIFRQNRLGYRGAVFKIFKFRSMRVMEDGAVVKQAQRSDPRVTRIGAFLRKSSVDELPQLVNVLLGDMSLVGPRPHAMAHDEFYSRTIWNYEVRQQVKPGITGWAQVNGYRGETTTVTMMQKRIEHDIWYSANASILLDIEIIVRTAFEVIIRRHNAY